MYQFYTAEIIKTQEGEFEHDIKWHYDENEQTAQLKGEAKTCGYSLFFSW